MTVFGVVTALPLNLYEKLIVMKEKKNNNNKFSENEAEAEYS